jgi:hypothetical protein
VEAACLAAIDKQSDSKIANALLTHREQRFRLSYVLGELVADSVVDQDDFSFDAPTSTAPDVEEGIPEADRTANAERILRYVGRIKKLASEIAGLTSEACGTFDTQQTPDDKAAWLELFSNQLFENEEFAKAASIFSPPTNSAARRPGGRRFGPSRATIERNFSARYAGFRAITSATSVAY